MYVRSLVCILFVISLCTCASGQTPVCPETTGIFTLKKNILLSAFLPKGVAEGVALRAYLRSPEWVEFRNEHSDRASLDEIFEDARDLCRDDRTATLLATCLAVLEHKTIPVKFLFGVVLPLPLTAESQEDFDSRVVNLPQHIYDAHIADRDKLQHFFFSAFFMRAIKMNSVVQLLGDGVEIGEDLFIIGGVNDVRDRHANNDGIRFGSQCDADTLLKPSECLTPNP